VPSPVDVYERPIRWEIVCTRWERLTNIFAGPEPPVLLPWQDTEGMRTKVIPLCLYEIGWENVTAVPVEEGKGCGESGEGDTPEDALSNDPSPAWLCFVDS
jgi:hypothetical protein